MSRSGIAIGAVVLVVAAALALTLVAPWRRTSVETDVLPAATPSAHTSVGVMTPPAGMQWVSYHGITVTLPATWPWRSTACDSRPGPGQFLVGPDGGKCVMGEPHLATVHLDDLGDAPRRGTAITVGGHVAYLLDTSQLDDPPTPLTVDVQLPAARVDLTIHIASGGMSAVQRVLDGIDYTPVDHHGCTAQLSPALLDTITPVPADATAGVVCEYASSSDDVSYLFGSRVLDGDEIDTVRHFASTQVRRVPAPNDVTMFGEETLTYRFTAGDGSVSTYSVAPSINGIDLPGAYR